MVLLLRRVRLVPVGGRPAPDGEVDVRVSADQVVAVAASLEPVAGEEVLDAEGRWLAPGLWDAHVHLTQWALTAGRLDTSGAGSVPEAAGLLAAHLAGLPDGPDAVQGFGHRSATWPSPPRVADLDAVAGHRPVVLISGDAHHGWLNSAALRLLGLPAREGVVAEREWFEAFPRLADLPGARDAQRRSVAAAVRAASARGVVGLGDMEFAASYDDWPRRVADGVTGLRVRAAVYPDRLAEVVGRGLRTGDRLDPAGLVTMGPLKIISDGSLNTRTAWCHRPYVDAGAGAADPRGVRNYPPPELEDLVRAGRAAGLDVAVHAIGDAAVAEALDVLAATGAHGSIEHAQLVDPADVPRLAALGVVASVQPAHLLDDRDVTMRCWPDRADRCFPLRSMLDAGVRLALGSDAPVARLDPWLAMAAAVWRGAPDAGPWNQAEALTPAQALAASTDGRGTVAAGSRADLVLLDADPLAPAADAREAASALRSMRVALTVVGGRITHRDL